MARNINPSSETVWLHKKSDTSAEEGAALSTRRVVKQSTSVGRNHNYRHVQYYALIETIKSLSSLSEGDSFYLNPDVSQQAIDFVGLMSANLTIDAPRLFPQDGEAAVFTWDDGKVKRLLTVDSDRIDIMDVDKATFMKCHHFVPIDKDNAHAFVLGELKNYAQSRSTSMEADD